MNRNLVLGLVFVVLIGGGTVWYVSHQAAPSKETIRIGAVLALTGEAATDGLNIQRGIDLAVADLAKKGVTVEVSYQDDKTDPKQTISALQFLLSTKQPQAIIGPTWSYLESAAAPVVASSKIVAYAPADTSEFADTLSAYQFHGAPRNALTEAPVAQWLKEHGKKRVAIIVDKGQWGISNEKALVAAAKDAGAEVVYDEEMVPFTADVANETATALLKIKNANADVLLWTGYEQEATTLARRRLELNFTIPVIAATTVYDSLLSRSTVTPDELKDMYYLAVPVSPDFVQKFKEKYGEAPGNYADRAYDGVMLLVNALQHAPAKDADTLATYLRSGVTYTGFAGAYEFTGKGDLKEGDWVIEPIVR